VRVLPSRLTTVLSFHSQADPQDFERLLMVEPLLTVRDFRTELNDEVADAGELLRNYEFNISQGIVQRVSRFFDALALMDERGEVPPARGEGADSARGGVMGFGHKRNVCNQEKKPARRGASEQQDAEMATLRAQVAEMQALAAPSLQRSTLYLTHASHTLRTLRTLRTLHAIYLCRLHPSTTCVLRRIWLLPRGGSRGCSVESRSLPSPGKLVS